MAGIQIEFPATERAVDLVQMKNFLRMDDIDEDDILIGGLIDAATIACETFCARSFLKRGFIQTLDAFPYFTDSMLSQQAYSPGYNSLPRYSTQLWNYSQMIKVLRPPLISIDRITYMDASLMSFVDLVPSPLPWYPQTSYLNGSQVTDSNGNIQELFLAVVTTAPEYGKSGVRPPVWAKNLNDVTAEASPSTAIWINRGPNVPGEFGSYIVSKISEPARLFPGLGQTGPTGNWPQVLHVPDSVQIHMTAGYPTAALIPQNCVIAIMQTVSDAYENRLPVREDGEQLPKHVRQLLWSSRVLDMSPTRG